MYFVPIFFPSFLNCSLGALMLRLHLFFLITGRPPLAPDNHALLPVNSPGALATWTCCISYLQPRVLPIKALFYPRLVPCSSALKLPFFLFLASYHLLRPEITRLLPSSTVCPCHLPAATCQLPACLRLLMRPSARQLFIFIFIFYWGLLRQAPCD